MDKREKCAAAFFKEPGVPAAVILVQPNTNEESQMPARNELFHL
jgi:hypothetical protein